MITEIKDIKKIRNKIGITQADLASISGVSQSLIAKIEAGKLDPAYSNAKKILDSLRSFTEKDELKAKDIMQKKVMKVSPDEDLVSARKIMKKYSISQIPVVKDNKILGHISESILLDAVFANKNAKIKEIMEESPPIISKNTNIHVVSGLLKFYPLIIVQEDGEMKGIITKADVIEKI